MLASGALTLIFGSHETSDFWADGLKLWWNRAKGQLGSIRRLVIYLDNGPNNSGTRTQFLKRMVEFADWSGLEVRLVYYPPYHSKYNPIERCWSALERFPRCSSTAIIFVSPQREQGPNHSCVSASGPCSRCGLHRLIMMPQHCGNRSKCRPNLFAHATGSERSTPTHFVDVSLETPRIA